MIFTRDCTACHRRLPEDSFRLRMDKTGCPRNAQCLDCERAKERIRARRRREGGRERVFAGYARCPREKVCDAAFTEWRAVGGAAFQGARL